MLTDFRRSFLSVPIFVRRAYKAVGSLGGKQYLMREGDTKQLVEEVMPVAALLKYLETPGREVRCRYAGGDDQGYDAEIKVSGAEVDRGFLEPQYFVEVTTAVFKLDHLRREALMRHGAVFMGPTIRAEGKKNSADRRMVSEAEVEDGDAATTNAISWIRKRLVDKAGKIYPKPCILVVNIEPDHPLSFHEWCEVAKGVQDAVDRDSFLATYVVDSRENFVLPL